MVVKNNPPLLPRAGAWPLHRGGPGGIRTPDLPLRRRLLCPLSYGPTKEAGVGSTPAGLERETGLEPATLGLEGRCSTN